MPNITHTTSRPSSPKSKLLVVRQPARSVRQIEQRERTPMRLAIGIVVAIGVLAVVWLTGHLGYRLGFAPLVRVPELIGEPGAGLATGTLMVINMPRVIFAAGLAQPMWLMLGFAMIAVPAAALGAAKPRTPGGPRPKEALQVIASIGAAGGMIADIVLIWWTSSPVRRGLLQPLPLSPNAVESWYEDLQTVAGLDVLAVVAAALWVVLTMRLPIATWLRAIAASAAVFTLVVVTTAMAMSSATASQAAAPRSLAVLGDQQNEWRLLLGSTPDHAATLSVRNGLALVELRNHPSAWTVADRQSIVGYLAEQAVTEEP
jgi:hypothetical protein